MTIGNVEQLNYGLALISPVEPLKERASQNQAGFHEEEKKSSGERLHWRVEAIASHLLSTVGLVPILYKAGDTVLLSMDEDDIARIFRERSLLINGNRVLLITYDQILCRVKQRAT